MQNTWTPSNMASLFRYPCLFEENSPEWFTLINDEVTPKNHLMQCKHIFHSPSWLSLKQSLLHSYFHRHDITQLLHHRSHTYTGIPISTFSKDYKYGLVGLRSFLRSRYVYVPLLLQLNILYNVGLVCHSLGQYTLNLVYCNIFIVETERTSFLETALQYNGIKPVQGNKSPRQLLNQSNLYLAFKSSYLKVWVRVSSRLDLLVNQDDLHTVFMCHCFPTVIQN